MVLPSRQLLSYSPGKGLGAEFAPSNQLLLPLLSHKKSCSLTAEALMNCGAWSLLSPSWSPPALSVPSKPALQHIWPGFSFVPPKAGVGICSMLWPQPKVEYLLFVSLLIYEQGLA